MVFYLTFGSAENPPLTLGDRVQLCEPLGAAAMSACQPGDVNADGHMTVDDVVTAVNVALGGWQDEAVIRA